MELFNNIPKTIPTQWIVIVLTVSVIIKLITFMLSFKSRKMKREDLRSMSARIENTERRLNSHSELYGCDRDRLNEEIESYNRLRVSYSMEDEFSIKELFVWAPHSRKIVPVVFKTAKIVDAIEC